MAFTNPVYAVYTFRNIISHIGNFAQYNYMTAQNGVYAEMAFTLEM